MCIRDRAYADRLMRFVDDPVLRYEMQPATSCGEGTTNALGMLDGPREPTKPPGTLRVACLGDSVGGDCSLPRDNACAALERVLRDVRGGRPTEVLNFSVPGYNTLQEARALELKASAFAPDVVVVLYVVNDAYPDLAISHYLPGKLKFQHLIYSGLRVASVLRRSRAQARPKPEGPTDLRGFSGAIEDISLASLLVLLEMERKTGMLVLRRRGTSERCRIFLRDGSIIAAFLDSDPTRRHAELLYSILNWSAGGFAFKSLPVEMTDEVRATTTHLLIEATRRLDEEERAFADGRIDLD